MLTHVGLFEGSGIPSLIARETGFRTVAQCEIDADCSYALKRLWPDAIHFDDVRTADWSKVSQPVTLLTAGVPCQPVSCAGKQKGCNDERWLWPDTLRAIQCLRPSWCLIENPPAIRLHGFERIVAEMEALGYECIPKGPDGEFTPLCIGAWAVGAPHKRDRVWIVANRPRKQREQRAERDGIGTCGELEHAISEPCGCGCNQSERGSEGRIAVRWPSRPGEPQHEWEAPRLTQFGVGDAATGLAGRIRSRTNKALLRMVGNGWCFPIPYLIYQWIVSVSEGIDR